jgi:pyruvate formate lyase activating enzyme
MSYVTATHVLRVDSFVQVLFCIKHLNAEKYASLVGLQQIGALRFAKELQQQGIPFWLRYVLIPGHTDDADGIKRLAEFAHQHQPALQVG